MERTGSVGPCIIAIIVVTALLAGCLGEEDEVPDPNPQAFVTGPGEAWVGDVVDFDARDSKDDDTEFEALNFSWDMGDGTRYWGKPFISQWITAPNHTYERSGTYKVNLTVLDVWGNAGNANWTIAVKYQLNWTVNAMGTWSSEDALNNTTYFNVTVKNEWTDLFELPRILPRMLNDTGGAINPRATAGDPVPVNLTPGQSFTIQVHFLVTGGFEAVRFSLCDELHLDLAGGT